VIASVRQKAASLGLPEQPVAELFALQIELSKAIQRRQSQPSSLELATQIRPALDQLGDRILLALVEARSTGLLTRLEPAELELLSPWLETSEREALAARLRALGPS
jgi:hypothetical protein